MTRTRHVLPHGLAGLLAGLVVAALVVAALPLLVRAVQDRRPPEPPTVAKPTFDATTIPPPAAPASTASGAPASGTPTALTTVSGPIGDLADVVMAHAGQATIGVTAVNLATRRQVVIGDPTAEATASIAKVDILAALLLQRQEAGEDLSEEERADAELAIRSSNNEAADRLLEAAGGAEAVEEANRRLGLTDTDIPEQDWIATTTTLSDQVALLNALVDEHSPLDATSRGYVYSLMRSVDEGQEWGVGRAGLDPAVKNGWMHREEVWEEWILNSIGTTRTVGGEECLVVVLTSGWTDLDAGIAAVDELAAAAVTAVTQ